MTIRIRKEHLDTICKMDEHLRDKLREKPKKLWENTYIKRQIDKREKEHGQFTINDHIRAMVYSMVSSGASWARLEDGIDLNTGRIEPLDKCFHEYDPKYITSCSLQDLICNIFKLGYASQYTRVQMTALPKNVEQLCRFHCECGSIDAYYRKFLTGSKPLNNLVCRLSSSGSSDKLQQLGVPLTAEYLKNVGYNLGKPDRHIRRILGGNVLGCSEKENVPVYDALDIISELAAKLNRPAAEVDYILWSYCAKDYGAICTKKHQKCCECRAKDICARDLCKA